MAYNRVRSCKFYIDAVLLARQLGYIEQENSSGLFYLNPTKTLDLEWTEVGDKFLSIQFTNRYFFNSISHSFILGHNFNSKNIIYGIKGESIPDGDGIFEDEYLYEGVSPPSSNGWHKFEWLDGIITNKDFVRIVVRLSSATAGTANIGDISVGWSYEMPHSPDMELTQTFGNESLKTQTTKGGVTLSNTGWNQPPMWGTRPAWRQGTDFVGYPTRRSWSLKFSYLNDTDLMPQHYNEIMTPNANNRGIFERTNVNNPDFNIKQDFLSKVYAGTNGFQLPFIFQPDSTVEEYAIARVNANSFTINQVANNVYDISMSVTECW